MTSVAMMLKKLEAQAQSQLNERNSTGIHYYNYFDLKAAIEAMLLEQQKPLDMEQLRAGIQVMNDRGNHTDLYKLLKAELSKRGWWKNKARRIPARDHFAKINDGTYIVNGQDKLTRVDLTSKKGKQ